MNDAETRGSAEGTDGEPRTPYVYTINDALGSVLDGSAFVAPCGDEECETLLVVLHAPMERCFPEQDCNCDDRPARAVYPPGAAVRDGAVYCALHAQDAPALPQPGETQPVAGRDFTPSSSSSPTKTEDPKPLPDDVRGLLEALEREKRFLAEGATHPTAIATLIADAASIRTFLSSYPEVKR